jgi:energy-coupling factor transporter transmembrane protein EcfT
MALHPTTRIFIGLSLIVASSVLGLPILLLTAALLAFALLYRGDEVVWRWIRRARWLLIVPPVVSGYVIAGDGVIPALDLWSPTWQGLALGMAQSLRLLVALLGLRFVLRPLSREQTTLGLTMLLSPLGYFGIDVSTFARRLGLTLAYIERLDGSSAGALLRGALPSRVAPLRIEASGVSTESPLGIRDGIVIAVALVVLVGVLS